MRRKATVLGICVLLSAGAPAFGQAPAAEKPPARTPSAAPSGAAEKALEAYLLKYLPWDPETQITVARTTERVVPGFRAYKAHRTGRYAKLNGDKVVFVSEDGKWFFAGDTLPNKVPKPIRSNDDLGWLSSYLNNVFHTAAPATLVPERDRAGLKGVLVTLETGYGRVHLPGYVTPDGRVFLQGTIFDYSEDPRAERRRMIDLSANRASGPADARVNVVEYADMECGYCKYRGLQMDRLIEANAGAVSVRRFYKFFPLWLAHVWAMKAASAGDCIFRLAGAPALFRFKQGVYAVQESLSVGGIDQLAVSTAEAEGISSADFLSCYLRDDSFARVLKDMDEGYRLSVNSTPTYFVDGTEITWIEDKIMEDYLRTLFPKVKTIEYEQRK
ncbi:MAG TPA: thioredoxin domain-containing protein [Thermoanaerobaculia bacterium]|nr:thioredoxin domain-containing protein [Thermoanaerobaculia bacterium]